MSEEINLIDEIDIFKRAKEQMAKIDDKMLLWLLRSTTLFDVPVFSYQSALVDELEDRLFPEYDGDNVRLEDFGWSTPDGLIIYSNAFCTCECHRKKNIIHANPCCAKCSHCFRHFTHAAYAKHDGKCSRRTLANEQPRQLNLSERELDVIINALNYAKGEWGSIDDEELAQLAEDADALEMRLKEQS